MFKYYILTTLFLLSLQLVEVKLKFTFSIDEHWVCYTKLNCLDCLTLSHCAWCNNTDTDEKPKCYSPKLTQDYCESDTIVHTNYGLSLRVNSQCSCAGGELEHNCRPYGASEDDPECSGRGECQCGRCVCNPSPNPDHPTKTIVGEFCEYDNFSCDHPDCNEGPYPLIPGLADTEERVNIDDELKEDEPEEELTNF